MPKRNKLPVLHESPDFSGIGRSDKNPYNWLIQKSKPLVTLSNTSMTLSEFKILDAYLSRIDSSNSDNRYVRFERGELEKLLGVSKINKSDLEKRLRNLFQVIEIKDSRKPKGFTLIALFSKAECLQDDKGLWQVDLACSSEALEYMFHPENIGYLKYRLRNVINITSRYSYILFLYILDNRHRKSWTINIDDLKSLLNCTAETYSEFKRFNDLVLKKCHKEINEKTDLKYSYSSIRKGRAIAEIRFEIKTLDDVFQSIETSKVTLNDNSEYSNQLNFFDSEDDSEEIDIDYGSDLANLLGEAACKNEFSPEQIRIIQDLVIKAVPVGSSLERCDYLIHQMHTLDYYASQKKIKNRFAYLKNILENEIKE